MCEQQFAVQIHVWVGPLFGQWAPTVMTIVQGAALFLYVVVMRLSVMDFSQLEKVVGTAILSGIQQAGLTVKEAADLMGTDYHHLQKALRGEEHRHVSHAQLVKLPMRFWVIYLPTLSALVVQRHMSELSQDVTEILSRKKVS